MARWQNSRQSGTAVRTAAGLAALGAILIATALVLAQVSQGGKGGGLPGHGPTGQGGNPPTTTGGAPMPYDQLVYHVLDRLTYGHTEADLTAIRMLGVDNWIRWQLRPGTIAESPALLTKQSYMQPPYTVVGDPNWGWYDLY